MGDKRLHAIDDDIGASLLQLALGAIAPCNTASLGARTSAHQYINSHIAHHQSLRGIKVERPERVEHRLGMRLGLLDIVGTNQIGDIGGDAHILRQLYQRVVRARRGNAQLNKRL